MIVAELSCEGAAGITNGGCTDCILLQQSIAERPCDAHSIAMDWQHCIACSGLAMAEQSEA